MIVHIALAAAVGLPLSGAQLGGPQSGAPAMAAKVGLPGERLAPQRGPRLPRSTTAVNAAAALVLGAGPGQDGVRVLHPGSLQPVASSPAFPASTTQVERSPDGRRFAAASDRGLTVFDARTGARVARIRVPTYRHVLSWLDDDRIALVKRGRPTTVRVVSVSARDVVRREVVRSPLADTARAGERQVTLHVVDCGDFPVLNVFGPDGALERTVDLPDLVDGTLQTVGDRVYVLDREQPLLYAVDPETGAVERHDLALDGTLDWVGSGLAVRVFGVDDEVAVLDPATFAVTARVPVSSYVEPAGDGFVTFEDEGRAPVRVFDASGVERWRVRGLSVMDVGVFGGRLYAGSGYDDVRVRVFDLASGRRVRVLRGRAALFEPSAGRVDVPSFGNPAIAED